MSLRRSVEKRSGPVLVLLSHMNRAVVPIVSVLLLLGGLALPAPIGVACLAVLAAFVGWLTYLSWPAIVGAARAVRVATLALILFAGASRLV
jgi:VIT1/CCC1 family predicted Fe2+/Mn2+ transporter